MSGFSLLRVQQWGPSARNDYGPANTGPVSFSLVSGKKPDGCPTAPDGICKRPRGAGAPTRPNVLEFSCFTESDETLCMSDRVEKDKGRPADPADDVNDGARVGDPYVPTVVGVDLMGNEVLNLAHFPLIRARVER